MATAEPGDDQPTTQYYIRWLEAANCLRGRTSRIDSIRFDWFDSFSVSSRISSWRHNSEWWTFRHRFESSPVNAPFSKETVGKGAVSTAVVGQTARHRQPPWRPRNAGNRATRRGCISTTSKQRTPEPYHLPVAETCEVVQTGLVIQHVIIDLCNTSIPESL